jgi:hypothetical protein
MSRLRRRLPGRGRAKPLQTKPTRGLEPRTPSLREASPEVDLACYRQVSSASLAPSRVVSAGLGTNFGTKNRAARIGPRRAGYGARGVGQNVDSSDRGSIAGRAALCGTRPQETRIWTTIRTRAHPARVPAVGRPDRRVERTLRQAARAGAFAGWDRSSPQLPRGRGRQASPGSSRSRVLVQRLRGPRLCAVGPMGPSTSHSSKLACRIGRSDPGLIFSRKGGMPDVVAWNSSNPLGSAIFIECNGPQEALGEAQEDWVWADQETGLEVTQIAVAVGPF